MKKLFSVIILSIFFFLGSQAKRSFPAFKLTTMDGKEITNKDLEGKQTIIVMFHIGCNPSMKLLNDLQQYSADMDTSKYQILGIAENSLFQMTQFFSNDTTNEWSVFRGKYKMPERLAFELLAECEITDQKAEQIVNTEPLCSKLGKKVKVKSSPTIVITNPEGNIVKKIRGYDQKGTYEGRISVFTKYLI